MSASAANVAYLFGLPAFNYKETSFVQSSTSVRTVCPHISQAKFFKDRVVCDRLIAEVGDIFELVDIFGDNFWLSPETNLSQVSLSDSIQLKALNPQKTGLMLKYDVTTETLSVSVIIGKLDKTQALSSKTEYDEDLKKAQSLLHKRFYDVEREEYHEVVLVERSNKYMEKVERGKKRKFATSTIVAFTVSDNMVDGEGQAITADDVIGDEEFIRDVCHEYSATEDFDIESLTIPHEGIKDIPSDPTPTPKALRGDRHLSKKLLELISIGGIPKCFGGKGLSYIVVELAMHLRKEAFDDSTLEDKVKELTQGYKMDTYVLVEFPQYFKGLSSSIDSLRATKERITRSDFAKAFLSWLREVEVEEFERSYQATGEQADTTISSSASSSCAY